MMRHHFESLFVARMIGDDQVRIIPIGKHVLPICRHYVVLPLIFDFMRRIASLVQIALHPALFANVLAGIHENAQIDQAAYFFVMKQKQSLQEYHLGRRDGDELALAFGMVEGVFRLGEASPFSNLHRSS